MVVTQFQGQEHIEDFGLNWISFKWRNHDPAIGRFFNIDPLAADYVHNSPYAFSENKVIAHVELEGLESTPFMNAKVYSDNRAYQKKVIESGDKKAIAQMRKEEVTGAIAGIGMFLGPAAYGVLSSGAATGGLVGAGMSGGLEAISSQSTGTSILTKTVSGAVGGSIVGYAGKGNFFYNMLVGAISGTAEEGSNQVLEKATGQREEINTALIVEGGWAGAIGNAAGTGLLSLLGLTSANTTNRIVAKNAIEIIMAEAENELQDAVNIEKEKRKEEEDSRRQNE